MRIGPRAGWDRFSELLGEDGTTLLTLPRDRLREQLDPFLVNPDRHREHVDIIIEAIAAASFVQPLLRNPIGRLYGPLFRKLAKSQFQTFRQRVDTLRNQLSVQAAPGELSLDLLPIRYSETPEEYRRAGLQGFVADMRLAVYLRDKLQPESVQLRLEILDAKSNGFRIIDWSPKSDFSELVGREEQRSTGNKETQSSKTVGELSTGIGDGPATVGGKLTDEKSTSSERSQTDSTKVTYQSTFPRIISDAVAGTARWQFYRTHTYIPVGGLLCSAVLLGPSMVRSTSISMRATVFVPGWGELTLRDKRDVQLPEDER